MKNQTGKVRTMKNALMCALMIAGLIAASGLVAGCAGPREPAMSARQASPPPPPPGGRAVRTRSRVTAPARTTSGPRAVVTTALPTGDKANSVVYVEKSTAREVVVGEPFDYTIKLTNITGSPLKGVTLTTTLPRNFTVIGTAPKAALAGSNATWDVGDLGPGETRTFAVRGKATTTGELVSCSEVTFRNPKFCLAAQAVQPALKVVKTMPSEVLLCDVITSRIVVTNTGSGMAKNVTVRDSLPAGMKTVDGKSEVVLDAGSLAPGKSREFTLRTRVSKTGNYSNKAQAAGDGLSATSNVAAVTVRQPILEVDHAAPPMRFVGRTATFTMTVKNTGDGVARETVLVATTPAGAKVVQASKGGSHTQGKVVWQLGSLRPGASAKATVTVEAATKGRLTNTAVAKAHCAEASKTATTTVKGIPAILLECVDLEDPIEVGSQETYVIAVTNQGSADGTNIVIQCTLPAQQAFVSAEGPTKGTADGKVMTFAPLARLAPKAKATYRVVVKGIGAGDVRFRVALTSDQMTSPAEESESTHIYAD